MVKSQRSSSFPLAVAVAVAVSTAVFAASSLVSFVDASTFQLNYDGIVSPKLFIQQKESAPATDLVEKVTKLIAHSIQSTNGNEEDQASNNDPDSNPLFELNCFLPREISFPGEDDIVSLESTKCVADYRKPGLMSFSITTSIYTVEDELLTTNTENYEPVAIMVDAIVKRTEEDDIMMVARDSLVDVVPIIDESILYHNEDEDENIVGDEEEKPSSVWSVKERPSPLKRREMNKSPVVNVSPSASIENKIFAKGGIEDKTQVYSSKISSSSSSRIDIWEFASATSGASHRDFFLGSTLRATTSAAGKAHAEAFVHPAIIAQTLPARVAVISDMPVAYVQEILKYKSITDITLVGSNPEAMDAVKTYMPQLNNCTLIQDVADSCLNDARVEVVFDDVKTWVENKVEECKDINYETECEFDEDEEKYTRCAPPPKYDVILVDVSSLDQAEEWLSQEFYGNLQGISIFESVIVINAGLSPNIDGELDYHERDNFFNVLVGENWDVAMVYDEPSGEPLNTAFIAVFGMLAESYYRFVRETSTSMDLDMIRRMHSQSLPLTEFYDGATHLRYLRPSHAWQNWFCSSEIGEDSLECTHLLKNWFNASNHGYMTEVIRDPVKGRSLVAAEDIPKWAFILGDDTHMSLDIDAHQWEALNTFIEQFPDAKLYKDLRDFYVAYGFQNEVQGTSGWTVSVASNNTFTNHACTKNDDKVGAFPFSNDPGVQDQAESTFSVVFHRHPKLAMATSALRDIKKGEEIMMDYSAFRTVRDPDFNKFLDGICSTGVGLVNASDGSSTTDSCMDDETC